MVYKYFVNFIIFVSIYCLKIKSESVIVISFGIKVRVCLFIWVVVCKIDIIIFIIIDISKIGFVI